jgi:hypothetical protein
MPTTAEAPDLSADLEHQFSNLVAEWKGGRGFTSSTREMARHPAYAAIIDLGRPVVPLLLRELEQRPDHWFIALRTLTGADPVLAEHRGQINLMVTDWLSWGRTNGYRW